MFWRKKTLLAKIQPTAEVDPVPTGMANAILATNVNLTGLSADKVSRNLETPHMGNQEKILAGEKVLLTFDVEAVGSGAAGVAPGWGVLHRSCGCAETIEEDTSVEYTPISASHEMVTFYVNVDGTLHKILGARGTFVLAMSAKAIPVHRYSYTGLFSQPVTSALPTVDVALFKRPKVSTKANTPTFELNSVATLKLRSFEFDRGGQIVKRDMMNYEGVEHTDSLETLKMQIEAVALGTYNPWTAPFGDPVEIAFTHGTVSGSRFSLAMPAFKQDEVSYANQDGIVEWPLAGDVLPVDGNDQWTLTLD